MKEVLKLGSCLLIVLLVFIASSALGSNYVNLVNNTEKWYSTEGNERCVVQKMHTLVTSHPGGLYRMHREFLKDNNVTSTEDQIFSYDTQGNVFYHGDLIGPDLEDPILWVDAPLAVGKTWTDSRPAINSDTKCVGSVFYVFAVLERETITCPAGSFDCFRVFLSEIHPNGQVNNQCYWYNNQCGMVMCSLQNNTQFKLVKVIPGENSDPDEDIHNPGYDDLPQGILGIPNPANPRTMVTFELGQSGKVSVDVFDISGRLVKRLIQDEFRMAGQVTHPWQGNDEHGRSVASGTYLLRVKAGNSMSTSRLTLVR